MRVTLKRPSLDWLVGLIAAIPFAYPKEPLYWGGIVVLLLVLPRLRLGAEGKQVLLYIAALSIVICAVNIFSNYSDVIYPLSVYGTLFTISFFMVRFGIRDLDEFVRGFLFVICVYILLTFIFFIVLRPFDYGFLFFTNSRLRMWGEGYLIEWPNVFCVFLVIGAFLFWMRNKYIWMTLAFVAAILTTSRMALVAIAFLAIYTVLKKVSVKVILSGFIVLIIGLFLYIYIGSDQQFIAYVSERLVKSGDRALIYHSLFEVFSNDLMGIGNIQFSSINEMYSSYHSSFLKVLVRYGFVGLLVFLLLVIPKKPLAYIGVKESLPIVFLLFVGLFQDMLFHIHLIIVFSVLIGLRNEKVKVGGACDR